MRIADKMNYEQVKSNLGKNRSEMADLQNQAATQKRVTKPSDDPLAATRILQMRTEIAGNSQFLKSVNQAKTFLEYSDQSMGELAEILMRAKELAINQSNDASASEATRKVTAAEVEQLFAQSVQVGNRKYADRFIFGGFRTTRPPFDPNGNYSGDDGEIRIAINKEAKIAMNIPGSRLFLGRQGTASPGATSSTRQQVEPDRGNEFRSEPSADEGPELRGPASERTTSQQSTADELNENGLGDDVSATWKTKGVNVFKVLSDLETGLRANDKVSVQESLDRLDEAIAQVVLARSELGARVGTLNSAVETLQKGSVDAKGLASNLEDADTFELVSDINKTESTLKATLETSGKLIQPSLLDFLR